MANQGDQATWNQRVLDIINANPQWGVDAFIPTNVIDFDDVTNPTTAGQDTRFYQNSLGLIKNNTTITPADWKDWGKQYSLFLGTTHAGGGFQARIQHRQHRNEPSGHASISSIENYQQGTGAGAIRFRAGFETGTFSEFDVVTGPTITVEAGGGNVKNGTFALRAQCASTFGACTKNFADAPKYYGRLYFKIITLPTAITTLMQFQTVTTGNFPLLRLGSTGKLVMAINDIAGGTTANQVNNDLFTPTLNTYYRLEWLMDYSSPTQGVLTAQAYNSAGTLVADNTSTPIVQSGVHFAATQLNGIKVGIVNAQATGGEYWIDDVGVNDFSLGSVGV